MSEQPAREYPGAPCHGCGNTEAKTHFDDCPWFSKKDERLGFKIVPRTQDKHER